METVKLVAFSFLLLVAVGLIALAVAYGGLGLYAAYVVVPR